MDQYFSCQHDIHRTSRISFLEHDGFRFQGDFFTLLSQPFQGGFVEKAENVNGLQDFFFLSEEIYDAELGIFILGLKVAEVKNKPLIYI